MSGLEDAIEAVNDILEWLDALMSIEALLEESLSDDDPGIPPKVSPSKKAEKHWPTTAHRTDLAPAWPPFSGHRVPLGGGGR